MFGFNMFKYHQDVMIHKLIKKYPLHQNYIQKVASNIESVDNMRVLLDENKKCGYELMNIIYYLADRIYYLSILTNKPLWWLNKIPLSFAYDKISNPSVLTHTHTDINIVLHDFPPYPSICYGLSVKWGYIL